MNELMQDLEEKELIEISTKTGFKVEVWPEDDRLARWNLFYNYRGNKGWLVTKRGARRSWANANVTMQFVRDRLGLIEVVTKLHVQAA